AQAPPPRCLFRDSRLQLWRRSTEGAARRLLVGARGGQRSAPGPLAVARTDRGFANAYACAGHGCDSVGFGALLIRARTPEESALVAARDGGAWGGAAETGG